MVVCTLVRIADQGAFGLVNHFVLDLHVGCHLALCPFVDCLDPLDHGIVCCTDVDRGCLGYRYQSCCNFFVYVVVGSYLAAVVLAVGFHRRSRFLILASVLNLLVYESWFVVVGVLGLGCRRNWLSRLGHLVVGRYVADIVCSRIGDV